MFLKDKIEKLKEMASLNPWYNYFFTDGIVIHDTYETDEYRVIIWSDYRGFSASFFSSKHRGCGGCYSSILDLVEKELRNSFLGTRKEGEV